MQPRPNDPGSNAEPLRAMLGRPAVPSTPITVRDFQHWEICDIPRDIRLEPRCPLLAPSPASTNSSGNLLDQIDHC